MRISHLRTLILVVVVARFGVVRNADAGTIFNNFGPSNSYDTTRAWGVEGAGFIACCGLKQAMGFTPVGNWMLTQIDLALLHSSDLGSTSAVLTLNSDSGGIPGGVLATWNIDSLPPSPCCATYTVMPSTPVFLSSGALYWLVASPAANDTFDFWMFNNTGSTGPSLSSSIVGEWGITTPSPFGAFDVQGTPFDVPGNPVPEPESGMMFSCGIVAFGGLWFLKQRKSLNGGKICRAVCPRTP